MREDTWSFRIVFGWAGPEAAIAVLAEHGTLEQLGRDDHAWTVHVAGDLGPGSAEEKAGRAEWIAQDALAALLSSTSGVDERNTPARFFTHQSTARIVSDGDG
ncbi:hypothetical protein GCM10022224_104470 [Nonomuraea antimicrobica]|uniref:Uncharacterized protein n=1 Tax=Nonomuraea antimicrobica TaxID=561173 RepID=A0ABP7EQG2_9ACTN